MLHKSTYQSGQIGVIILLIMVVILTIGLTVASRTTQEAFLTTQTAESTRVFNAAEAGVEEALSRDITSLTQDVTTGSVNIDDTEVNYSITQVKGLQTKLFEGVSVAVNVTGVTTGGSNGLTIDWSAETCGQDPASLLASIYSVSGGVTTVRYRALGNCARGDGFEQASTLGSGAYRYRFTLPLQTNDRIVRIQPVYNDTTINVSRSGSWTFPTQYYRIRSEATNDFGNESRIVEVNRTLPTAPSVMDYALYSGTTIIK